MGLLSWTIIGLIAGALGKLLHPGKDPAGFFVTALIGICGGIVGGTLGEKLLGWQNLDGFNFRSLAIATAGSILVLFIWRLLNKKDAA